MSQKIYAKNIRMQTRGTPNAKWVSSDLTLFPEPLAISFSLALRSCLLPFLPSPPSLSLSRFLSLSLPLLIRLFQAHHRRRQAVWLVLQISFLPLLYSQYYDIRNKNRRQSAVHSVGKKRLPRKRVTPPGQRSLVLLAVRSQLSISSLVLYPLPLPLDLCLPFLSFSLCSTLHYLVSAAGSLVSLLFSG